MVRSSTFDGSIDGLGKIDASLEPPFARRFGDRQAFVDMRASDAASDLPIARIGSLFANQHGFGFGNVVLERQYDALVMASTPS